MSRKSVKNIRGGNYKDFGDSVRVKPILNPGPNNWKKRGRTYDLNRIRNLTL